MTKLRVRVHARAETNAAVARTAGQDVFQTECLMEVIP
jgi:hypothetical protein